MLIKDRTVLFWCSLKWIYYTVLSIPLLFLKSCFFNFVYTFNSLRILTTESQMHDLCVMQTYKAGQLSKQVVTSYPWPCLQTICIYTNKYGVFFSLIGSFFVCFSVYISDIYNFVIVFILWLILSKKGWSALYCLIFEQTS